MANLRRVTRSLPAVLSAATTLVAQERSPAADPHAGALGSSSSLYRPWSTADLAHLRYSSPSGLPHTTGGELVFLPSSHASSVIWLALDRSALFAAPKSKEEVGSIDDLGEVSGESQRSGSSGDSSDSSDSDDEESDSSDSSDTDDDENGTDKDEVIRQLYHFDRKDLSDRRKAYLKEFRSRLKSHEQEACRAAIHKTMLELCAAARSHAEKDTKGVADLGKKVFNYPARTLGMLSAISVGSSFGLPFICSFLWLSKRGGSSSSHLVRD